MVIMKLFMVIKLFGSVAVIFGVFAEAQDAQAAQVTPVAPITPVTPVAPATPATPAAQLCCSMTNTTVGTIIFNSINYCITYSIDANRCQKNDPQIKFAEAGCRCVGYLLGNQYLTSTSCDFPKDANCLATLQNCRGANSTSAGAPSTFINCAGKYAYDKVIAGGFCSNSNYQSTGVCSVKSSELQKMGKMSLWSTVCPLYDFYHCQGLLINGFNLTIAELIKTSITTIIKTQPVNQDYVNNTIKCITDSVPNASSTSTTDNITLCGPGADSLSSMVLPASVCVNNKYAVPSYCAQHS